MRKRIRLIILLSCVALFLIFAPYIVLYSMGYRVDFVKMKITATGGIYIRTSPQASAIIIDSKINTKPGMFANSVFVQDLLAKEHYVLIKKDGYYDYNKILPVRENQVTKLENVLLIKQNIVFNLLSEKTDYFSISPDGKNILLAGPAPKAIGFEYFTLSNPNQKMNYSLPLQNAEVSDIKWSDNSSVALIKIQNMAAISYYIFDSSKTIQQTAALPYLDKNSQQTSFDPRDIQQLFYVENKTLYSLKNNKVAAVIDNLIAYKIYNGNILWLSSDGFLSQSDTSGKLTQKLTAKKIATDLNKNYQILIIAGKTFLKENGALYLLNPDTKIFENFNVPITDYEILPSPDNKNLLLKNSDQIYLYSFADLPAQAGKKYENMFSGSRITDYYWLNNDYIVFTAEGKIIISEIDYRGNINSVALENENSKIFFNRPDGKLYTLTNSTLFSSEKITP
ncbi:MAG: hypothetical protein UR98_C0007G0010 [Parcubacteria group bacterium GW2011_GWA1_36_12]|nr:MAG: hypothetical protein UR98_C0007G0010 [Parcubacteria group bacterium GW2011_GWA1_36_12]